MKNYSDDREFHLSIAPAGENQYLLRTERVAAGVPLAEELIVWPIEIWLSQAASNDLPPTDNSPDMAVRDWAYVNYRWDESSTTAEQQTDSSCSPSSSPILLGIQIYAALFQGTIQNSWITAQEIARLRGEALQVRLILKDRRLASLPWALVPIGEFLGKDNACRQKTDFIEDGRDAYPDESDASDSDRCLMEEQDLNDSEYEEDTTFISGLLTQLSQPNSQLESANDNLVHNLSNPPENNSNENSLQPISSDRNSISGNADAENQKINRNDLNSSIRNFIPLFVQQNWLIANKKIIWLSLALVFLTTSSLLYARNRWLGWQSLNYLPESSFSKSPSEALPKTPSSDIEKLSNSKLAEIAVENFRQGNLENGQQMVETLLNRNALPQAKFALAGVSLNQRNSSAIDFLYGRLAWQSVRAGNNAYTVEDARRYWENALKKQPNSPLYHNALGFAYYTQGNITKANQAWFDGLYHAQEELAAKTESHRRQNQNLQNPLPTPAHLLSSKDVLTAYAGLSLVLWRSAQNQPADKKSRLMVKAIELSQKVIHDDPVNFQPQALQTNWLWTKQQIQDWRNLQQIKGMGNRE